MEQEEIWRDIEGYERIYQVSNLGRVKSLDRIDCRGRMTSGVILKPKIIHTGYLHIGLYKEGKGKWFYVHRLVAQAFIPNPDNLPQINHKDEDKTNNVVFLKDDGSVDEFRSNLEWCTAKYNSNYGTHIERIVQANISNGRYDPELCGLTEKEYNSLYSQKNREKKLEYRQKNRDRIFEYNHTYYQKNRDQIIERQREYNQKNRERINERDRLKYQKNRDQINERRRERRLKKKQSSEESLW